MKIVGAGMSGLLAANMLVRHKPTIIEAQNELPNNHSAVLRFRSSVVGDVLGIPFRKVQMIKCPVPWRNPVSDSLAYSFKCSSQYRSDRSITMGLVTETRYIAPINLIERMADGLNIQYGVTFHRLSVKSKEGPIISTLPMPKLMEILGYTDDIPKFTYTEGLNIKAKIEDCDAFVSLLIPDPIVPISRVSITGNELIIEVSKVTGDIIPEVLASYAVDILLGIDSKKVSDISAHKQTYEKIIPIDDDQRKRFIAWATDKYNIYSLGRYATWRPNLLLDDLVNDVRKIEGWVNKPDDYAMRKYRSS